jgi:thioredoxin 1
MREIIAADFETEVLDSAVPVLIKWTAGWCRPCLALQPILEKLEGEREDVKIMKVDVDNSHELAIEYGIRSVPTLILFKDGIEAKTLRGLVSRDEILKMITPTD